MKELNNFTGPNSYEQLSVPRPHPPSIRALIGHGAAATSIRTSCVRMRCANAMRVIQTIL
jgi:hypothetical protein